GFVKDVYGSVDAINAFEGSVNAATQWLPLVVLVGLRPALRKWGIAAAVLLLPLATFGTALALAVSFGLWTAVVAKGAETSLRYSAERFGRELLYVPVRPEIKLKAKAYIDIAVEKGIGKLVSFLLIGALLLVLEGREVAYATVGLAGLAVLLAFRLRREYTRTLGRAIENRFASWRGTWASLVDASTLPLIRRAQAEGAPGRLAFTLELLAQADDRDERALAPELNGLILHQHDDIRAAALGQLARVPELADVAAVRQQVRARAEAVRDAAVRVLVAGAGPAAPALLAELLRDDLPAVRTAALHCLVGNGGLPAARELDRAYIEARWERVAGADADARAELALAAGGLQGDPEAGRFLAPFLDDPDSRVRSVALRSAAVLGRVDCCARMIEALRDPATREAARDALALIGEPAVAPLAAALLDNRAPADLRRLIPATLARIPTQQTVDVMLRLVLAPETDQLLDFRTLKALGKLRARHPELQFDPQLVWQVAEREADHALRYAAVAARLDGAGARDPVGGLLLRALAEGERERREGVFRCLGLLYPPEEMLRAFLAVSGGTRTARANAAEWLEQVIGPARTRRLAAAIEPAACAHPNLGPQDLIADGDGWIAALARIHTHSPETGMELIEKVFLLQQVDLLRGARSAHVALLASIADEVDVPAGTVLLPAGEPPAALFVVARGSVELQGVGERLVMGRDGAFGTWALIDEEPSPLEARTLEPSRLLRVTRADFHDLLDDHGELALGLLQGLAHRVRSLVA
ncbi:MAG: cyclic nucleotide-binding domain-containing protein, partial [Gemmatimonadetes bacterium]|nr:cyclic nucleotide-binding domain-containing protein [Gemmatimonadota bacterium]